MLSKRKSGGGCSAVNCTRRRNTNAFSQVKMYRFPRNPYRRAAWSNAMKRDNWIPTDNSLICDAHFVTGKPSCEQQHPDYVPSIFDFKPHAREEGEKKLKRYERTIKRMMHDTLSGNSNIDSEQDDADDVCSLPDVTFPTTRDASTQTEIGQEKIEYFEKKIKSLEEENTRLRDKTLFTKTFDMVVNQSNKTFKFYTGLENFAVFSSLLILILQGWQPKIKSALQPSEQLLLVLMKLRLGLMNRDLACRFEIGIGTVSKIFHSWLNAFYVKLSPLISWPSQKQIKRKLPQCFKDAAIENVRCIIDCTEVFIEKPKNFVARAQTYSNYKHHNTIKFLVGITPHGRICFISKAWGGRVSDRHLTIKSGFLNHLQKDDTILADRGFKIEDLLSGKQAKLIIPSSTKNKKQLSFQEVHMSRNMSKVRVHVERAIRKMKTFRILNGNISISMLKSNDEEQVTTIDKILSVISILCNLSKPIIKA